MENKLRLNNLNAPIGANRRKKRVGRGVGSGHGKTSGQGSKGEKSRSGGNINPGFEGGQMPLIRRIPKFGFSPFNKEELQLVNVESLNLFKENEIVTPLTLKEKGLIKNDVKKVKILAKGELKKPLTVKSDEFSNGAIEKITKIGGKAVTRSDKPVLIKIKEKAKEIKKPIPGAETQKTPEAPTSETPKLKSQVKQDKKENSSGSKRPEAKGGHPKPR